MKILVSSTFSDLQPERAAAIEAIERVEHAEAMERFPASDEAPRDECIGRVRESDALVLIIGDRYGSLDPVTGYSITELEYRTAHELGIPVFAYLKVGEDGSWTSVETDPEQRVKHQTFKRLVDAQQVRRPFRTFQTADKLQIEILASLYRYAQGHGRVGAPGAAFETPSQFFGHYLDPQRVFNHTFPLVGRRSYVESLRDAPSLTQRVILLNGTGGMGKTKLLQAAIVELQNAHPEVVVCMLAENTYRKEDAQELPTGELVIVVDDAHRVSGLSELFTLTQQFPDHIHLVLATRPHGLRTLRQGLAFAGFDATDILELPELHELAYEDVAALAQEVIGTQQGARLAQLVAVSRDSPLITVIAGQLLTRNRLDPALLANGDTQAFQIHVLARFQDIVLGQVASEYDHDLVLKTLRLVAALTPLDPEHAVTMEHAATFLALTPDELLLVLSALERDGVLVRRSGLLRITPDVLSDYILQGACFTASGQLTGYGQRILDTFGGVQPRVVMENLAELDWRVSDGKGTGLLGTVWQRLREAYRVASYQDRLSLLDVVARVAYFQPSEALAFVRLALEAPPPPEAATTGQFPYLSDEDVRHALAPLLRNTAYYEGHLRESVALLWQIGRDDGRLAEKETDHPIRVLQTLAGYMRNKPPRHNEVMIEWLEELVHSGDAEGHHYSPLDIVPALLQREGTETWTQGNSLIMASFLVNPTTTAALRERALSLLATLAHRGDTAMRRRVVRALVNVVFRGMIGLGNYRPTEEQIAAWQDEDRTILRMVAELMEAEENPAMVVEVEDDLIAIRANPKHTAIADDMARVIEQLPTTLESTLIRYLCQGRIQRRLLANRQSATVDGDALDVMLAQEFEETLDVFFATYMVPEDIKRELERLLEQLADAGVDSTESFLIERLCRREPDMMARVCDLIIADPASPAVRRLPIMLNMLREHDVSHFVSCLTTAESSDHVELRQMAAWALAGPTVPANEQERDLIERFASDPDRSTALAGLQALTRFSSEYDGAVFRTLDQVAIGDDDALADRICMLFDNTWGIAHARLPMPFVSAFLDKLVSIADWTQRYQIADFVDWVTASDPEQAARFYLARLAYQQQLPPDHAWVYSPVPALVGAGQMRASAAPEQEQISALRALRDHVLRLTHHQEVQLLAEIFARVSRQYADPALDVLKEWIDSGESDKVLGAARLLEAAPLDFVFAREAQVVHLLEVAQGFGRDTLEHVQASLEASTTPLVRGGWVGAPDQADVEVRDRATATAARYPPGHVAHEFYQRLRDTSVSNIESSTRMWESLNR